MNRLQFVVSPLLTTLRLVWEHDCSLASFQMFLLESSPRIHYFCLDAEDSTEDEKVECLKFLPLLRTLDVEFIQHDGLVRQPEIGATFCSALREWDESNNSFVVCPELEKLMIGYNNLLDTTTTVFVDMVEERWRRSLREGKNFRLELRNVDESAGKEHDSLSEFHRIR